MRSASNASSTTRRLRSSPLKRISAAIHRVDTFHRNKRFYHCAEISHGQTPDAPITRCLYAAMSVLRTTRKEKIFHALCRAVEVMLGK
ncbi:hypothetical protein MESS2_990007 [Mesorhizobium metallidurans STM 2683]|uniref:Transposase n=1 Tax=Mesorhizobium metallidurans STM 2683 TaxID=1297569 RepID=M5EZ88_9HYPH|nr:hypothetical protein MESS2_990007 [Mesorhizobium metallidurans STM 2683]